MEQRSSGGGNAVPSLAIIAIVALVLFFAWFFMVRGSGSPEGKAAEVTPAQTPAPADNEINIKVDLPDSVVIK